jgi:signal transduction histidine kinase
VIVETSEQDIVEPATAVARRSAVAKGLAFAVRFEAKRRVRVDPDLTRSALQNLVDNAVKYTDAGGVEVAIGATDAVWSIHVRATCPGLSCEELVTIFKPYRRGSTRKQGTGLGLAIARRAIEAQGGHAPGRVDRPLRLSLLDRAPETLIAPCASRE